MQALRMLQSLVKDLYLGLVLHNHKGQSLGWKVCMLDTMVGGFFQWAIRCLLKVEALCSEVSKECSLFGFHRCYRVNMGQCIRKAALLLGIYLAHNCDWGHFGCTGVKPSKNLYMNTWLYGVFGPAANVKYYNWEVGRQPLYCHYGSTVIWTLFLVFLLLHDPNIWVIVGTMLVLLYELVLSCGSFMCALCGSII